MNVDKFQLKISKNDLNSENSMSKAIFNTLV